MDEATKELVARIRESTAKKVGHGWPKAMFNEAADALEALCTELAIKESVVGALENTIRDERLENSLKMAEIVRYRHALEQILKSPPDQCYDFANLALDNVDV